MSFRYGIRFFILVGAFAAFGCVADPDLIPHPERERTLDLAFSLAGSDPARAAGLFTDVGPGPSLEHARLSVWADCLDRTGAGPDEWRRFLRDQPAEDLTIRARLALVRSLVDEGLFETATTESLLLPVEHRPEADAILLTADDPEVRLEAAARMAINSPSSLTAADRELDRRLASGLSAEDRLERASSWLRAGRPSIAVSELQRERWSGRNEIRRRRELARAELATGSSLRALRVLPGRGDAEAEDEILRAWSFRNRGWYLFPAGGAKRQFADCLSAAESAIALDSDGGHRLAGLILRLECATEGGELEAAIAAWRQLEAAGWSDSRREWLGRRLGVALTRVGGTSETVLDIARSLPSQQRCLRYWTAVNSGTRRHELAALADAGFADLYAWWSRQELALPPRPSIGLGERLEAGTPPDPVARLFAAGSADEALAQWQRIRLSRHTVPQEALAAAEACAGHGRLTVAIQWLRNGFPELGTIDMALAPENVVRAYLPLRFEKALAAAAVESGLDPWLLAGVARQESVFAAHAMSPRGAVGVLQLLPSTARLHARDLGLKSPPDLRDPGSNLRIGARELSALIRRFGAIEPALAAYNAGVTRVRGWWKQWPNRHRFTEEIPVPETYHYVRRVVYLSEAYRQVYDEQWRNGP